jgi:hypothetical protein
MKKQFSFIEKYSFRHVLGFYLILIILQITIILKRYNTQVYSSDHNIWFNVGVGLIVIIMAVSQLKYLLEKAGFILLGIALLLNSSILKLNYPVIIIGSFALEVGSLYCLWLLQNNLKDIREGKHTCIEKNRSLTKAIMVVGMLLLPAILLWLFGMLQNF